MQSKNSGYDEALRDVLKVRFERQKVYGDTWKQNQDWEILAMMKHKLGRLEDFVINKRDQKLYENERDTLVDLINYSLFLLQNKIDKQKGGD